MSSVPIRVTVIVMIVIVIVVVIVIVIVIQVFDSVSSIRRRSTGYLPCANDEEEKKAKPIRHQA